MSTHRYEDIRKIMIVKTIVESGSIQKAARELKVTPSAVSQSLSSLEKKLGKPLFLRIQGNLSPTTECLDLLEKAKPAFTALDSLFHESEEPLRIGSLDLGTYESLAHSVLADFVTNLRSAHKDVKLNITVSRTAELLKRLRSGEICTAMVVETDGMDRIRTEQIASDELGLFVSSKYADRISDWDFICSLGFGFITVAADGIPFYMKRFYRQLGQRPKVGMTSDSFEVLRRAAASGLVAAVLPHRVANRELQDLAEVTSFQGKPKQERGEHKILLASLDRCDEAESKYLAKLARECFSKETAQKDRN